MVKIADKLAVNLPKENILIVDAMNLAFRWKPYKAKKGEKPAQVKPFVDDFVKTVESLARSYNCGTIVIAADQGGSSYRKDIFPEYKGNRKELYADDTPEEKEVTRKFFDEYERVVEACDRRFTLFRFQGVEADDIAAYIVKQRREFGIEQIWLISSDRDWDLLVDEYVSRFSTVTRKEQTVDTWDNIVSREDYLSFKCLTGDKGDNIPGVPGVGPKRAADLIDQYGSIFDIHDACPIPGKSKYIAALNESKDQLLLNVELMDLIEFCEEAIGRQNCVEIESRLCQR